MAEQGCRLRVPAKGTKLYIRRYQTAGNPTFANSVRIGGVTGIQGISFKRSGNVDATELAPDPDGAADPAAFFYTGKCPGTKDIDPLVVQLNMSWEMYVLLTAIYGSDEEIMVYIKLRNGKVIYLLNAFIDSIEMGIEENEMVKTPVTFISSFAANYVDSEAALPTTGYTTTTAAP